MSIEKELAARGISRSYPFYSIAKKHGVSYSSVLGVADNHREHRQQCPSAGVTLSASQQAAVDEMREYGEAGKVVVDSLISDIHLAGFHFQSIQDGEIPAFPG